jgi:hypothetical protein
MRLNTLLALAGNLIGIAPLTWAIRRLMARHVPARAARLLPAETSSTVTIEIHSEGHRQATSITASVTFPGVNQSPTGRSREAVPAQNRCPE